MPGHPQIPCGITHPTPPHCCCPRVLHKEWKILTPKNILHINNTATDTWVHTDTQKTHWDAHTGQVSLILQSTRLTPETLSAVVSTTPLPSLMSPAVTSVSLMVQSSALYAGSEWRGWFRTGGHMLMTSQPSELCMLVAVTRGITRPDAASLAEGWGWSSR